MELSLGTYRLIVNLPIEQIGMLLVLMALTTLSYFYMRRLRKERTVKLGNFETLKNVHGKKSLASPSILLVKLFTVTMLFLVASGSITLLSEEPVSDTDFAVAIDNSQSMLTPDYPPSRLGFTKSAITDWASRLPARTDVAVIAFGGSAETIQTPKASEEQLKQTISSIQPDVDSSGTAIGEAVDTGITQLEASENKKRIVLVTDGENTAGMNVTPAIDRAERNNVTVDIVGISSTQRTEEIFSNLSDSLEESQFEGEVQRPEVNGERLKAYAEQTGGNYYEITSTDFMDSSLRKIVLEKESVQLNSSYYLLIFISLLIISEMLLYSKFGAI